MSSGFRLSAAPILGNLQNRSHMPQTRGPRLQVPAGSVGIGGAQTGIRIPPGGWQLIGLTLGSYSIRCGSLRFLLHATAIAYALLPQRRNMLNIIRARDLYLRAG